MGNKLTLEHLAPYLPYGVLFISEMDKPYDEYGRQPIWTLNGISEMFGDYCLLTKQNSDAYDIVTCKPILHPLSELTKEIEHNGDTFVPILKWCDLPDWATVISKGYSNKHYYATFGIEDDIVTYKIPTDVNSMNYYTVQKLFSWHFDLHGLIDKNLAVDINTLKGGQDE